MYYSAIGLLAVLILLIENQDILRSRGAFFAEGPWRVYRRFLFAILAYYITDILWGILESGKLARLLFIDTTIYYIAMAVGVLFWIQFTVDYLDERNAIARFLVFAGRLIALLITLLAVVNIFVPVLFTVDAYSVYRALTLRHVMLVVQIVLLLLISAYAVSSILRSETGKRAAYRTIALFGLAMALFLSIQLWYPELPLYTVAYMLGTSLLHSFVASDEKAEYKRDLEHAAKIRELKDIISSLLDNMPGMTFTKDAVSGAYLACNQAFALYAHRQSPEEVVGQTDAELFDDATALRFAEDNRMALSMDEPYIFYEDLRDAEGNQRQYQTTEVKYVDAAGRLCLLALRQDVTDMVCIRRENATTRDAYEKARSTGLIFSHMAQAMARGYSALFYINVDTEEYIEYRTDKESGSLIERRRGWHFFEQCRFEIEQLVYPDDRAAIHKALERRTLVAELERNPSLILTCRLLLDSVPRYVNVRLSRMEDDERCIVMGILDVDEQMKQRRAAERMREEQIAYARLNALSGDYLSIYVVVPETGRYREFSAGTGLKSVARPKEGQNFFADLRAQAGMVVYADDRSRFLAALTMENVMAEIRRSGIFTLSYRILIESLPHYVQLKAAMVEEKEGQRLIVGISDIDAQVRQEEEYVRHLAQAQNEANVDALTGVKNRHAYLTAEDQLNSRIAGPQPPEFAIVILDVNDLKKVNDSAGHQAGDQYLRDACKIICDTFKHSPVFRVGGDEFAVIAQGSDYACIEALVGLVSAHNDEALRSGGVVIACGMSRYAQDESVGVVFDRADQQMYENKCELKEKRSV